MNIDVSSLDYKELNETLRASGDEVTIDGCLGQRFIAAGMSKKKLTINGVPGNALGAYLNGASVTVNADYHFFRGARVGDRLTAEAREIKPGRTICVCEARVTNQDGTLLGVGTFTLCRLDRES